MEQFRILIFGDICPARGIKRDIDKSSLENLFREILSTTVGFDLVMANLESPATTSNLPIVKCGPNLKASEQDIALFKNCGISVLSLANNHILDYGEPGIRDTLNFIRAQGIDSVGGGVNADDAKQPLIKTIRNKKIGILAFAEEEFNGAYVQRAGANIFDPYESFNTIEKTKLYCDYVIVLYHGGIEHYEFPSPLLQKKCRKMIDSGADFVTCQHSHCIGASENYHGGTILYGQGNTAFGHRENDEQWNLGLIVSIELNDIAEAKIDYLPIQAKKDGVHFADSQISQQILDHHNLISKQLEKSEFLAEKWDEFCRGKASLYLPMLLCKNRVFNKLNRITGNILIKLLCSKDKQRVAMNLIRCDAHREVIQRVLELGQE